MRENDKAPGTEVHSKAKSIPAPPPRCERADLWTSAAFVDALQLFSVGASWGGYESLALIAPPRRLRSHTYWQGQEAVIRLHIGLEDADDLILDLAQAFRSVLS